MRPFLGRVLRALGGRVGQFVRPAIGVGIHLAVGLDAGKALLDGIQQAGERMVAGLLQPEDLAWASRLDFTESIEGAAGDFRQQRRVLR